MNKEEQDGRKDLEGVIREERIRQERERHTHTEKVTKVRNLWLIHDKQINKNSDTLA